VADRTLRLANIGPIKEADITLGDLTVLVGPQASGKSVFLQFLRLLLDTGPILRTLVRYGLDWEKQADKFLEVYLGEGTGGMWQPRVSSITWQGINQPLDQLVRSKRGRSVERCFFIPAQRVLALSRDGWLRPFADYKPADPFVVRDFSEKLRFLMESGLGSGEAVFPQPKRLKSTIRELLASSIFSGFQLELDKTGPQKRLVLSDKRHTTRLPYMVWSAGQREFVPLLLGLYWLLPPTKTPRRGNIEWVIIEELEMGLHPRAIETMLVIVLDLLWRGYRVCLSTHSPHVLDLAWALRNLQDNGGGSEDVLDIFGVKHTRPMRDIGESLLKSEAKVFYFDGSSGKAHDISNLDPASSKSVEAGWGGLTELSGRAAEVVARVVARRDRRG
jgi:energy-coupling factor transporter ATP-binding protein EcfA2